MAQLKSSVVQGSLRVTDTTYTTDLNLASATASRLLGTDANKNAVSIDMSVSAPAASGNATAFITSVSQGTDGKISASKATVPTASTSTTGIMKVGTGLGVSNGTVSVAYGTTASTAVQGNQTIFTLNGSAKNSGSSASFYAPTSGGTAGQALISAGTSAPSWYGGLTLTGTAATSWIASFTGTTDSTSTTTGAVKIDGGLGVAQSLYASSLYGTKFEATHTSGGKDEFRVKYSSTIDMSFMVGTADINHGIYDHIKSAWVLSAGADNNWSFNGNAATATKATQDGSGNTITNKYFQIYNTSYQGNSSSVTVNDLATQGPAYGMINSATDNPTGGATWIHVLNMGWSKANTSWIGQIALHTNGSTLYIRGNSSSAITGKAWNTVLSSNNYSSYALPLSGGTLTGTLNLKPASGEGGEIHLCASTANTTQAGIILDQQSSTFRIFGIPSADGTTKTGNGTPLVIDPYGKTITGGYTLTGTLNGNATSASNLLSNTRMDYGWNGINYFNIAAANQSAAKVNDTPSSASTWWHILRFNHGNSAGYYTDLAVPFNANTVYYKRIDNGALQNSTTNGGWVGMLDVLNYSSYALPLSGGTMTGSIKQKLTGVTRQVKPSANQGRTMEFIDSGSNRLAQVEYVKTTDGTTRLNLWVLADAASGTNTYGGIYIYGAYQNTACYSASYNINTGRFTATSVANAIWNDYAEYRQTNHEVHYGQCVIDNDDGSLSITQKRLLPGAQIVSDTWGHIMGETKTAKTPVAVAGRVLAYPYRDRYEYHAGMAVCSAPNGTVDIMTREEIMMYPDCIIGIVSEIPEYETWGTGNVEVNGRIWIKVK